MNTCKKLVLIAFLLGITACTGRTVYMKNEAGETTKCSVEMAAAMFSGVILRDSAIERCIHEKKAEGFRVVSDESSVN